MSVRTDWMDCKTQVRRIDELVEANFGDHFADASMALTVLEGQIEEAYRCLQVARQQHLLDVANADREAAEARIAELVGGRSK